MDFLTYIQTLQNELIANHVTQDQIHGIITQESALAETKKASELQAFFTPDRIKNIVSLSKREYVSHEDETKTIAPQGCLKNTDVAANNEEKTILPQSPKATLQSLTDEATMVVISGNTQANFEETTMAATPDLKKLLAENATVRISEKATVFFRNQPDKTSSSPKEDETVQHVPLTKKMFPPADTDATLPAYKATVVASEAVIEEQTRPIPARVSHPHKKNENTTSSKISQRQEATPPKVAKNENTTSAHPLSPDTLRNPHPRFSFFWLAFLLVPSICFLAVLIIFFIFLADLLFLLAFTAIMLFYLSFLLIPLFLALYSAFFAFLYWKDFRILEGLSEFGLMLFSSGLSLMFGYLFYRPFILVAEWIGEKCKSFNKKTFLLLRNLYRYSVKGAEKL